MDTTMTIDQGISLINQAPRDSRFSFALKVVRAQLSFTLLEQEDGDLTMSVLRKALTSVGEWIREVTRQGGFTLPLLSFEKSLYKEFGKESGLKMYTLRGLLCGGSKEKAPAVSTVVVPSASAAAPAKVSAEVVPAPAAEPVYTVGSAEAVSAASVVHRPLTVEEAVAVIAAQSASEQREAFVLATVKAQVSFTLFELVDGELTLSLLRKVFRTVGKWLQAVNQGGGFNLRLMEIEKVLYKELEKECGLKLYWLRGLLCGPKVDSAAPSVPVLAYASVERSLSGFVASAVSGDSAMAGQIPVEAISGNDGSAVRTGRRRSRFVNRARRFNRSAHSVSPTPAARTMPAAC